ncbi:hypothetical protein BH11CYA1_BH11CYA1_12840 [soil metagenome]
MQSKSSATSAFSTKKGVTVKQRPLVSLASFLMAISLGFCSLPVQAVSFGITPFPKGGENATPKDQTNALKMCVDAGVTGIFYGGTWADLEPSKGTYSLTQLGKTLKYSPKLKRFLGVQVFDITTKNMPTDLTKSKLDSPKVVARFAQLMARLKKATGGNIAYLSIGNEADVYLSKHPKDVDTFMKFFALAKKEVVKAFPGCKVGITLRAENMLNGKEPSALAKQLLAESDVVMLNYYPIENYKPKKPQQIEADMQTLTKIADGKSIVFQEIGYPSSPKLGSSDKNQADFIELAFKEIRNNPQVEFANFFALHDLTPAICDFLAEHYTISSKDYRQAMQSIGLRKSSGKARPSWDAMKKGLAEKPAVKPVETKPEVTKPEDMPTDVAPGEKLPIDSQPATPDTKGPDATTPTTTPADPAATPAATPGATSGNTSGAAPTNSVDPATTPTETAGGSEAKPEVKPEVKSESEAKTEESKTESKSSSKSEEKSDEKKGKSMFGLFKSKSKSE